MYMSTMATDEIKRMTKFVNLSIHEVAEALDTCTYEMRYILDLQDQEIICLSEHLMTNEEIQEIFDEIDEDETGRYVPFPVHTDSRDGYADMQQFIDAITDQHIRTKADQTIKGSGAFRRFRDFIRAYPDLEERWYIWRDEQSSLRAAEWLEEEGLVLMKKATMNRGFI